MLFGTLYFGEIQCILLISVFCTERYYVKYRVTGLKTLYFVKNTADYRTNTSTAFNGNHCLLRTGEYLLLSYHHHISLPGYHEEPFAFFLLARMQTWLVCVGASG